MVTLLTVLAVTLVPYAAIVVLLLLAERARRARDECRLRQIAVTDAIHREVGAVVAPVVSRGVLGPWRVRIAVPLDRPALVGAVLAAAQRALAPVPSSRVEIVLVPRSG